MLADTEDAENDLAAILTDEYNLYATLAYNVEGITRIILEQDDTSLRIRLLARDRDELVQCVALQPREERHCRQKIAGFHGVGIEVRELTHPAKRRVAIRSLHKLAGTKMRMRRVNR